MQESVNPFLCEGDVEALDINVALVGGVEFLDEASASPFVSAFVKHVLPHLAIGPLSVGMIIFMLFPIRTWDHPQQVIVSSDRQAILEDLPSGLLIREKRRSNEGEELVSVKPVIRSAPETTETISLSGVAAANATGTGVLDTDQPPTGTAAAVPLPPTVTVQ